MKIFTILTLLVTLSAHAELRSWLTSTGTEFDAVFSGHKSGSVSLTAESGKKATLKVEELSVVDRLYLIENENIAEEELLDGYKKDSEKRLKLDSKAFKKDGSITITAGDQNIDFTVFKTPNFEIWSEGKVNFKKVGMIAEQCWFYNAWRNPLYSKSRSGKKELLILTTSEDGIRHLIQYHAENNPQMSKRDLASMETRWHQEMRGFKIPTTLAIERNLKPYCYLVRNDAHDLDDENDGIHFLTIYTRYLFQTSEIGVDLFNDHHGTGQYIVYAHGFDSELAYYGELITGMGTETGGSGNYGAPKDFGKKLAKLIKSGEVEIDLNTFFSEKKDLRTKPEFGWQVASFGRFLHSDMKHEIGTARFLTLAHEKKSLPSLSEMAECYGYEDAQAMTEAFITFLEKDNLR